MGRDQAHPPAPRRRRAVHPHVLGRGANRGAHLPPERRASVRPREARRHLLDRHGVPARRTAARDHARGRGRRRAHHGRTPRRQSDLRCGRGSARRARTPRQGRQAPQPGASRRHAAQPVSHLRRRGQGGGLRHRQGHWSAVDHTRGDAEGQARVYEPGAGPRHLHRPAHRHFCAGRGALGAHHRTPSIPHGQRPRDAGAGAVLRRSAALQHHRQLPGRTRIDRDARAGQGPQSALCLRPRHVARAAAVRDARRRVRWT